MMENEVERFPMFRLPKEGRSSIEDIPTDERIYQ